MLNWRNTAQRRGKQSSGRRRPQRNMRLTRLGLILMFLCISGVSTYAQSEPKWAIPASLLPQFTVSSTQDADELKTQQQLVAEVKFLRKENAALKDENLNLKGAAQVTERIIGIEKERGDFFKDAAAKGIKISDNSTVIEMKYDQIVNQYRDENGRLRSENDKLRSSRNWWALVSGIGGAGLGYAACR